MKRNALYSLACLLALSGLAFGQTVESLRGVDPDAPLAVNPNYHQEQGRQERNYRQQPPVIPHTIEKYQIDKKANECLACHDWQNAADRGAPTLSMTHYSSRDGVQTDQIAPRRWFCNACHVPQLDAPALIENEFHGTKE